MWDTRDKSKTYSYPGCRGDEDEHADDYYNADTVQFSDTKMELMMFKQVGSIAAKSAYTLNIKSLRPTQNSPIQTALTQELKELTMKVYPHLFTLRAHNPNWIPRKTTRPHIEKEYTEALHRRLLNPSSRPPAPTK